MKRLVFLCAAALPFVRAAAAPVDFVREVRPILEKHCYECHGEKKQKSGLRLDVKAAALQGGEERGPIALAGKAQESPLIQLVTSPDCLLIRVHLITSVLFSLDVIFKDK